MNTNLKAPDKILDKIDFLKENNILRRVITKDVFEVDAQADIKVLIDAEKIETEGSIKIGSAISWVSIPKILSLLEVIKEFLRKEK